MKKETWKNYFNSFFCGKYNLRPFHIVLHSCQRSEDGGSGFPSRVPGRQVGPSGRDIGPGCHFSLSLDLVSLKKNVL